MTAARRACTLDARAGSQRSRHLNRNDQISRKCVRPIGGCFVSVCVSGVGVMVAEIVAVIETLAVAAVKLLPMLLILGAIFAVLSCFWACHPGRPWWRKRELVTDLCYWFIIPLFARYLRIGLLVLAAAWLFGITTIEGLAAFLGGGHGPLAHLPPWAQAAIFLIASDFMLYWIHRAFHSRAMWPYHAVHHASEDLEWISAARLHPVNVFLGSVVADVVLLLAGISPNVLVVLGPFMIAHSAFTHANLDWTLGPFKYVIAGPVFHRWHHTAAGRGGEKNFAAIFPVLDLMFGTFIMPKDKVPDAYGIPDPVPPSFLGQMVYPFRRGGSEVAMGRSPGPRASGGRPAFAVDSPISRHLGTERPAHSAAAYWPGPMRQGAGE
jgi:sterol desaturase/sphingolipid hydroxylase (fatty acid hydroxylase superfamily)